MNEFLGAFVISCAVMGLVAADSRRRGKLDGVDIGWAGTIVCCAWWYFAAQHERLAASSIAALFIVTIWGARLILHLFHDRLLKPEEDGRYQDLKKGWGANTERNVTLFFVAQGFLGLLFSLAPYSALRWGTNFPPLVWAGVSIFVMAQIGVAVADRQLAQFRSDLTNRGQVCRIGLWRYSRHPNYFFEWLIWIAYVPLAGGGWWLALVPVVVLLYLLMFVTGIPPTEAQSLRSRGAAYREYQRTTSPFFPLPPR